MKYFIIIAIIIAVAVTALFVIDKNDVLLIAAIVTIIAGFWYAVFQIPKESDSESK